VRKLPYTLIFLETPHRMTEALADLLSVLGDRPAAAARELTKIHEEILRLPLSALQAHFKKVEPRGEFTLVVQGAPPDVDIWDEERVDQSLRAGLTRGDLPAELAERVAAQAGWRKNQVYRRIIAIDRQT
jgi:16S rRNA (cytidine1402-2'-O)-methyltransferase